MFKKIFRLIANFFTRGKSEQNEKITPVLVMAEGVWEVLIKRGLKKFLMQDYVTDINFLIHTYCYDKNETKNILNEMLIHILYFLELPPFINLIIKYDNDENTQAGSYTKREYNRTITIKIRDGYTLIHAVSILCHECVHYFMEFHKLNWNDTALNEQRTDVVTNLIGFNNIMRRGYSQFETVERSFFSQKVTRHKIGYITAEDCFDLRDFIIAQRKKFLEQQEKEKAILKIKKDSEKLLETAKNLTQLLNFIDIKNLKTASLEQVVEIQKILIEKENRNISNEIQQHENNLNKKNNFEQIKKENQALNQLCTELAYWLTILGRINNKK